MPKAEEVELEFGRIPNPPASYSEMEQDIEEAHERFERRVVDLDDDIKMELELELQLIVEDWIANRSGLEEKLRGWNDLLEGVTSETDFPWVGASNLHIPLPKIKAREITATINRSTMRPVPFLTTKYCGPSSLYESSKNFTKDLENFVEDKLKNDTNIHQTFKDAIVPIFRDGTVPIQIMWETSYEMVTDWKLYEKAQDFATDYPSADEAGISKQKYNEILKMLVDGKRYEAEFEYNLAIYDGPKAYLVPLVDFVHWPVWIPRIRDMKVHGKRVWYTDYQLKQKVRMGLFKEEDIELVLRFTGGEQRQDQVTISRDNIEGINRQTDKNSKEYQVFELVYTGALTKKDKDDDVVRKYLIHYHHLSQKVIRVESYPIRKGKPSYFALRFLNRDNRFLGISLLDDISDLSAEIDIQHRQRINSRTITHVPSFKAKMSAKNTFDPSRREFRFRPGATYYLADPATDVVQFDIRPVDLSGSVEDEMLLYQLVDMVTGSSSGLSGQANPIDPRAPARKQQELLRQSSNRIDDYVQNMLPVFEEAAQFVVDLYYQYAKDRITYYVRSEDGEILKKEMERSKLFNPNVKFKITGTSVFENPEQEYSRMVEIENIIAANPITQGIPRIRRASLERVLMAARVEDEKTFLPNKQEMPQAFTTDEEREREAKNKLAQEKMAARMGGDAEKRAHEIKVIQAQADADARNMIIEAAVTPTAAPAGAAAGAATPSPAGVPLPMPIEPGVPGAA